MRNRGYLIAALFLGVLPLWIRIPSGQGESHKLNPIRLVGASYPRLASLAHTSGEVRLEGEVSPAGSVQNPRVLSGPGLLVGTARDAFLQWRYPQCTAPANCQVDAIFTFVITSEACDLAACRTDVQVDLPRSVTIRSGSPRAIAN